jgi:hypothetical protein
LRSASGNLLRFALPNGIAVTLLLRNGLLPGGSPVCGLSTLPDILPLMVEACICLLVR